MLTAVTITGIIAYLLAALLLSQRISAPNVMRKRTRYLSILALASHLLVLVNVFTETAFVKINLFTTLAIITWIISALNTVRGEQPASILLRPAIYGFAATSLLLIMLVPSEVGRPFFMSAIFATHISLALVASSVLTLATLYGLQLLYVNRLLKTHSAKIVSERIPSLMAVEQYFFRLLTAGFIILTLAIVVGFIYLDDLFASGQLHKTVFTLLAWLSFGSIVVIHYWRGLRGKIAVYYTLLASLLLVLGYFGSRFVRDILIG